MKKLLFILLLPMIVVGQDSTHEYYQGAINSAIHARYPTAEFYSAGDSVRFDGWQDEVSFTLIFNPTNFKADSYGFVREGDTAVIMTLTYDTKPTLPAVSMFYDTIDITYDSLIAMNRGYQAEGTNNLFSLYHKYGADVWQKNYRTAGGDSVEYYNGRFLQFEFPDTTNGGPDTAYTLIDTTDASSGYIEVGIDTLFMADATYPLDIDIPIWIHQRGHASYGSGHEDSYQIASFVFDGPTGSILTGIGFFGGRSPSEDSTTLWLGIWADCDVGEGDSPELVLDTAYHGEKLPLRATLYDAMNVTLVNGGRYYANATIPTSAGINDTLGSPTAAVLDNWGHEGASAVADVGSNDGSEIYVADTASHTGTERQSFGFANSTLADADSFFVLYDMIDANNLGVDFGFVHADFYAQTGQDTTWLTGPVGTGSGRWAQYAHHRWKNTKLDSLELVIRPTTTLSTNQEIRIDSLTLIVQGSEASNTNYGWAMFNDRNDGQGASTWDNYTTAFAEPALGFDLNCNPDFKEPKHGFFWISYQEPAPAKLTDGVTIIDGAIF